MNHLIPHRGNYGESRTRITLNADRETYDLILATQRHIEQLTELPPSLTAAMTYLIKNGAKATNIKP